MSTKITYNGTTTEVADGYIATLPCKDLKMETDVVVEAPEGGSSIVIWNGYTAYAPDAIVIFEKIYYVCIKATTAGSVVNNPSVTPSEWKRLNGAYKGEYDSSTTYYLGDIVLSNNNLYQSKIDNPETTPDNDMASRWTLLHEGGGGGGAELNIAYGDTAPEDTSKLWVKTTQPSKVKVSSNIESGTSNEGFETLEAALPTNYTIPSTVAIGDKIYIFGGGKSAIMCWDTTTNTMRTLDTTLPTAKSRMGVAAVGDKIYLFGGANSYWTISTKDILVFDTETETITTHSTQLYSHEYNNEGHPTAVAMGTVIWLINGCDDGFGIFDTASGNLEMTGITQATYATTGTAAQAVGNNVYVFGGYETLGTPSPLNKIRKVDTTTKTAKTLVATLPSKMHEMASAVFGSSIFLFGGLTAESTGSAVSTVLRFDTIDETISTMPIVLPQVKAGVHTAAVVEDNAYLFAGVSSADITKFVPNLRYLLENNNLQILPTYLSNKFNLINTNTAQVEIGVKKVYKGNTDGIAEEVEASLHNGTSWVTI